MHRNLYREITDRILEQLRAGVVPWRQRWSSQGFGAMPRNAATGRAYSGVNVLLLWGTATERGYTDNRWLTFKQAQDAGGAVRKGERGCGVVYVNTYEKEDETTGELVKRPFLKAFTVFNVAQVDGLPSDLQPFQPLPINKDRRDDLVDGFLACTGADIRHGEGRAYYNRLDDFIMLPDFRSFVSADLYYATAFHELTHWTGAEYRLNRTKGKTFGDREYSFEELVAELGAAFLSAEWGVDHVADASAYIDHWVRLLDQHEGALISAASHASKAALYCRDLALQDTRKAA